MHHIHIIIALAYTKSVIINSNACLQLFSRRYNIYYDNVEFMDADKKGFVTKDELIDFQVKEYSPMSTVEKVCLLFIHHTQNTLLSFIIIESSIKSASWLDGQTKDISHWSNPKPIVKIDSISLWVNHIDLKLND